jgi:cytidylate kinase
MTEHGLPERTSEAVLRAFQHWEKHREDEGKPTAFTIAISREVGARGTTVARELGRRLGWTVYDHELLERIAGELGLRTNLLESIDERRVSWLQECVEALVAVPSVSEGTYVRRLVETVLSLGVLGKCIIVGRGAAQILPAATTLRVRLVADRADRIGVMSQERGLSPAEAARHVEREELERARFVREHFRKDPTDPQHYDLILNTSRFSVAACADLIMQALHLMQKAA